MNPSFVVGDLEGNFAMLKEHGGYKLTSDLQDAYCFDKAGYAQYVADVVGKQIGKTLSIVKVKQIISIV